MAVILTWVFEVFVSRARGATAAVCLLAGVFAGATPLCIRAGEQDENRILVLAVEMTNAGKKVQPPTPEEPVYYIPVLLGYKERGTLVKHFERKPEEKTIVKSLLSSLAKQGYLIATARFPPSLTITFEWGTIAPVFDKHRVLNAGEIRTIVMGESEWDVTNQFAGHADELQSLTSRHYLLVSAFRYQRTPKKPEVLLWRAHSTTDAWGDFLDDAIKPLIAAAAPGYGRATKPVTSWIEERTGRVLIGESRVVREPLSRRHGPK